MNSYDPNERGSRAQDDLGGGLRAAREGELAGQNDPAKKTRLRALSDPDAQQLGTRADVTASDEQLDNNLDHIRKLRAERIKAAQGSVAETALQGAGVQQELFDQ